MASIKTAISVDKPLFEEIEALAREMEVSRSHLFEMAAREFIRRHKNRKLLDAINEAYEEPTPAEKRLKTGMKYKHRRLVTGTW